MASVVDDALVPLQSCIKSKEMVGQFEQLTKFRLTNQITEMNLSVPQTAQTTQHLLSVLRENILKLR